MARRLEPPPVLETLADKRRFSIAEVAPLFGVHVQAIHKWMHAGRIRQVSRSSVRGKHFIPRSELVRLLRAAGREVPGLWVRPPVQRLKLLLIDDDRGIRRLIQEASRRGFLDVDLKAAPNVEDGLLLAAGFRPDVIALDYFYSAGRLRGDQAVRFLRKTAAMKGVRVVGLAVQRDQALRMLRAGAQAVLIKPFDLGEFRTLIGAKRKVPGGAGSSTRRPPRGA